MVNIQEKFVFLKIYISEHVVRLIIINSDVVEISQYGFGEFSEFIQIPVKFIYSDSCKTNLFIS